MGFSTDNDILWHGCRVGVSDQFGETASYAKTFGILNDLAKYMLC